MSMFAALLAHLWRGGAFGYFWRLSDKQSAWFPTDRTPAIPTGARDLYFGVHPVAAPKGAYERGKIEDVAAINCLFAEFDGKDFGGKDAAMDYVARLIPRPSVVVDSGGGFHAYWLLADTFYLRDAVSRERAKRVQRAWVAYTGGDPGAADLARVLRVPGTLNAKYDPPREVKFVSADFRCVYELSELEALAGDTLPARDNGHKQEDLPAGGDGKIRQGTRNTTLFKLGCAMRRRGVLPENIETALLLENAARCDPPLDEAEVLRIAASVGRYEPAPDNGQGWPLSDAGNAEAFAAHYTDRICYAHNRRTWLIWRPPIWARDEDGEAERLALASVRRRQEEAMRLPDEEKRRKTMQFLLNSESDFRLSAMLRIARTLPGIAKSGREFDARPDLLAVKNGVIDLRTGTFREGQQDDYLTQCAGTHYDPSATAPRWERFLAEVFENDAGLIAFFRRAVGYIMTGWTHEQCFFFLCGTGRNGKSKLLATLRALLGDYAKHADFSTFAKRERDGNGHKDDLMALEGARLVTAVESKTVGALAEDVLKAIVGEDPVTGSRKYERTYTYQPTYKLMLAANNLPRVDDVSDGFWRKVILIPFHAKFEGPREDKRILEKLLLELPGILNWAIGGVLEYQAEGLKPPARCIDAAEAWRADNDPLREFIQNCRVGARLETRVSDLFAAYERFCQEHGVHQAVKSLHAFSPLVQAHGFKRETRRDGKYFIGIAPPGQL